MARATKRTKKAPKARKPAPGDTGPRLLEDVMAGLGEDDQRRVLTWIDIRRQDAHKSDPSVAQVIAWVELELDEPEPSPERAPPRPPDVPPRVPVGEEAFALRVLRHLLDEVDADVEQPYGEAVMVPLFARRLAETLSHELAAEDAEALGLIDHRAIGEATPEQLMRLLDLRDLRVVVCDVSRALWGAAVVREVPRGA